MDDLDFSSMTPAPAKPATPPAPVAAKPPAAPEVVSLYEPKLALAFFKLAGTQEQFAAGTQIFAENEKTSGFFSKGARIYLLLEGDVILTRAGKPLDLVPPGEIFGEMAAIAEMPRSATATARKSLPRPVAGRKILPAIAAADAGVRPDADERDGPAPAPRAGPLATANKPSVEALDHAATLDKKMLADLVNALGDPTPSVASAGKVVVTKGAVGACMFVVTEGRIAISVDDKVIEHVGPGGTFGEMALVDKSGRSATATAETDCAWLLIGRNEFLAMVKTRPAFGIALMRSLSARVLHIGKLLGG
jgi:CRP/FNR family cyclic AMP-dependent transcriptional regulator